MFTKFTDRQGRRVLIPNNVTIDVDKYSATAVGGMEEAELTVSGGGREFIQSVLGWLRYSVVILNGNLTPVWWGYVAEVSISSGAVAYQASLDDVANSIAVAYTEDVGGRSVRGTTSYSQDAVSVSEFGERQLLLSMSDADEAAALARQAAELADRKYPRAAISISDGGLQAKLFCRGWADTFNWKYYSNAAGLEQHTAGSGELPIGLGISGAATVGFVAKTKRIWDEAGSMDVFPKDFRIRITGSTSNNGTVTVAQSTDVAAESVTGTTFSFSGNRITDSAGSAFTFLSANQIIKVVGSASNDGWYIVKSHSNDGAWVDVTATFTTEAAGATVSVSRGNSVQVNETLTDELPGASVTLSGATYAAESFQLSSSAGWTVASVSVKASKTGAPTDGLVVSIRADSSGQPASTDLEAVTIPASSISEESAWVTASFSGTLSLSPSTTYWLVVGRSGAVSASDYYSVAVDKAAGYSGSMLAWDGIGWYTPSPPADLLFAVKGAVDTGTQLQEMLNSCEFVTAVDPYTSGVSTNQYRDGDGRTGDEIRELLDLGDSSGTRLLLSVSEERRVTIYPQPSATSAKRLTTDGRIVGIGERELDRGVLPVGEYLKLEQFEAVDYIVRDDVVFVESAEFDARRGTLRIFPAAELDIGRINEG